jgi:hypothetical protein
VVIGAAVFDEHFRTGAIPGGIELLALAVIALATVVLSRPPAVHRPTRNGALGSN